MYSVEFISARLAMMVNLLETPSASIFSDTRSARFTVIAKAEILTQAKEMTIGTRNMNADARSFTVTANA